MFKLQMFKFLKLFCLLGLVLGVMLSAASCKKNPGDNADPSDNAQPSSGLALSGEEAKELNSKVKIIAYFVSEDKAKLEGELRYMEIGEAKQSTENIASTIVTELLKGPSKDFSGKRIIPEGTKLLSPVTISGSLAVVNLSKEFVNNSSAEKKDIDMSIYSLVNSVTEIKELDRVKILIDGKEEASFKGVVEMNLPFKRNKALISVKPVEVKDTAGGVDDDDDVLLE